MGAAAYNRGTRRIAAEADALMGAVADRADRQALREENERLRAQVADLKKTLARARRCLAAERLGRESVRARLAAEERANEFSTAILCRLAFPGDQ
jgi:uncharacterized protein YlxW (UPF0749 family)